MIQADDYIQTLMDLGLTLVQAKTYLTLAKLQKAKVKTIEKASSVPKQDIYRIMPALQKLGLAEKLIADPVMYKGTPLQEGLSILYKYRAKEFAEMQRKTLCLLKNVQKNGVREAVLTDDWELVVTSEFTLFIKRLENETDKTQASIDISGPLIAVKAAIFNLTQRFRKATKRHVRIRMLIMKTKDKESMPRIPSSLKNPLFEIRCVTDKVPVAWAIFDRKNVHVCLGNPPVPNFCSNNHAILTIATGYFDELWKQGQEYKPKIGRNLPTKESE